MKAIHADQTLDCYGLWCPMPVRLTAKRMTRMAPGDVLEVMATDPAIQLDMPAWCHQTGHEFLGCEARDSEFRAFIRKRDVLNSQRKGVPSFQTFRKKGDTLRFGSEDVPGGGG